MKETKKSDFINYEILTLTFNGGLQRSGIYADKVSETNRSEFRNSVRDKINALVKSVTLFATADGRH
jgi:hypothetical protein